MSGKIASPRLEKLEKEFSQNGGEWKDIPAERLFLIKGNPQLNKDSFIFTEEEKYPYFTRTVLNNGVSGYVEYLDEEHKICGNSIAVGMLGMQFFYMEKDFYAGQFTKTLFPKFDYFNKKIALYFVSLLNKNKQIFQSVLVRDFEKTFNEVKLRLPFLNGKINFSYMEKFIEELETERIEELETERIEELEAYLAATGLKDYHLTKYDEEVLDKFNKLSENADRQTDKIRLEDIFDWQTSVKELNPLHLDKLYCNGERYPFYGQAIENNGIIDYISLANEVLNNKNSQPTILIHSNNQNIVYLETPFYLKDGHGATSVLQNNKMNKYSALYLIGAIDKVIKEKFNYNAKATKIGLKNTTIEVPVIDNEFDFKFMEDFIKVIEKIIIKDVVLWTNKKITTFKQVVNYK